FQKSDGGELLADANGKTLYAHDREARPSFNGVAQARAMETPQLWAPVLAGLDDKPVGQWSIVEKPDGTRQWAHKGKELYTNVRDKEPGDLNGIRSTDRVWHTIMRSGATMAGAAN
ncbi:MAG: hypothetical protein KDE14_15380, partial [Rhodobacteraceae bacterium]|nr:hypothetical protein [Paracoccaceae bacterium]